MLIAAIVLAVLYFGLIELLLIDSQRELKEAQRFRARVVAITLAENGAELAAHDLRNSTGVPQVEQNANGTMRGTANYSQGRFLLTGEGAAAGVVEQRATVRIEGSMDEASGDVVIDYAYHSQ